jgi:hypothetical protein
MTHTSAPPALQASTDDLQGNRGQPTSDQARQGVPPIPFDHCRRLLGDDLGDLPPVTAMRALADPIEAGARAAAVFAAAWFVAALIMAH